ncbi:hypothetical protein [Tautonia plasticadhaerens]|uniref:Uncharacterized protein n=1 Tax=Tautonia plasticadhaerens TaxID=2527974 RepID=A0A518H282_9BACT|nr:hypothetical protein [Tautonia plasticadhaerens]QDV34934.1 hypothetical protein ElP_28310 [Tautonia plasticadhaerens]
MTTLALPTIGHNAPPSDAEMLRESLLSAHESLLTNAEKLVESVGRIPERCEDDSTAGKIGDLIKLLTGQRKNLESARVAEKEPFLSLGRAVDGFFKGYIDQLDAAKTKAQKPLDAYLKLKAEEERRRRLEEAEALRLQAEKEAEAAAALEAAQLQPLAESALDQAQVTEQQALRAHASAAAKPAGMAQARGSSGSLASLRTRWVGEVTDRNQLDLDALRAHIPLEALQKAVNAFVAAGGRELKGAKIFEKSEAVVR